MELLNALKWRYAVKKMNGKAVAAQDVETIVEAARLAPTSAGIQPFEVIVVSNPELKKQILPIAFNQQQIVDCSHLLVFAAWDSYTTERIEEYITRTETERGMPANTMADFKKKLHDNFTTKSAEENFVHTARQAYIGFGVALAAAAELKARFNSYGRI